jgi:glycosyltransferase involved in cell wall biosynthesis
VSVDVIIPVGPGPQPFAGVALSSSLRATSQESSIIIVLDGRERLPEDMMEVWDSRCCSIVNRGVRGISGAMNTGLRESESQFIAVMHADDVMHADRLARQTQVMTAHPELGALGTQTISVYGGDQVPPQFRASPKHGHMTILPVKQLLRSNPLVDPSTMFRRTALDQVGGYTCGLTSMQDYDVLLKIAKHYEVGILDEVLLAYRQHPGQFSKRRRAWREWQSLGTRRRELSRCRLGASGPGVRAHLVDLSRHSMRSVAYRSRYLWHTGVAPRLRSV